MPSVRPNPTTCTVNTNCHDETPPGKPVVSRCMAFGRLPDDSQLVPLANTRVTTFGGRDPFYLELHNVEPSTHVEILNKSAKPDATWTDAVKLEFTGVDATGRKAAVYLTDEQMQKKGIAPGDIICLRLVDPAGNASEAVYNVEVEGRSWQNNRRRILAGGNMHAGNRFDMLDGAPGKLKRVWAATVADTRDPIVLENRLRLITENNQLVLSFNRAVEPDARLKITNMRTGKSKTITAENPSKNYSFAIPPGADGDTYILETSDNNGRSAKPIELRYCKESPNGIAPKLGILDARLPGVI